jgi:hypothetical protein
VRLGRMRRLAAGAVVVGALIPAGAGAASACDGGHHGGVAGTSYTVRGWEHHGHGLLSVAESYLGLPKSTIVDDLKAGRSLGEIANATAGKSAAGLVDAYEAALKTKLDRWVAAGKIDTTKENEILAAAAPWITKLVNAHFTGWHRSFDRH